MRKIVLNGCIKGFFWNDLEFPLRSTFKPKFEWSSYHNINGNKGWKMDGLAVDIYKQSKGFRKKLYFKISGKETDVMYFKNKLLFVLEKNK